MNALTDKIWEKHNFLLYPFKYPYPLYFLKNVIADRIAPDRPKFSSPSSSNMNS